jgi:hypothetical protein
MFRFLDTVTGGGPTRSMSRGLVFSRAGLLAALQSYLARSIARVKTRKDGQANTVIHTGRPPRRLIVVFPTERMRI